MSNPTLPFALVHGFDEHMPVLSAHDSLAPLPESTTGLSGHPLGGPADLPHLATAIVPEAPRTRRRYVNPRLKRPARRGEGRKRLPNPPSAGQMNPMEDLNIKDQLRQCEWEWGTCTHTVPAGASWKHISDMKGPHGKALRAEAEANGGKVYCRWPGCGQELSYGSLRKHVQVLHFDLRIACIYCGNQERQDPYLSNHGLAKNCPANPNRPANASPPLALTDPLDGWVPQPQPQLSPSTSSSTTPAQSLPQLQPQPQPSPSTSSNTTPAQSPYSSTSSLLPRTSHRWCPYNRVNVDHSSTGAHTVVPSISKLSRTRPSRAGRQSRARMPAVPSPADFSTHHTSPAPPHHAHPFNHLSEWLQPVQFEDFAAPAPAPAPMPSPAWRVPVPAPATEATPPQEHSLAQVATSPLTPHSFDDPLSFEFLMFTEFPPTEDTIDFSPFIQANEPFPWA
ncbi:hypothetical protein C8T65DRAFT_297939 [Cerioporus squamosus]|nr:hypothetical protein C8T65DRAFT_297939 [Cerioporus squamosus]